MSAIIIVFVFPYLFISFMGVNDLENIALISFKKIIKKLKKTRHSKLNQLFCPLSSLIVKFLQELREMRENILYYDRINFITSNTRNDWFVIIILALLVNKFCLSLIYHHQTIVPFYYFTMRTI